MGKICAFFGHREIPDGTEEFLRDVVRMAIEDYGVTEFWNGGLGGFDRLAEKVVYSMKGEFPHIKHRIVCAYQPQYPPRRAFDGEIYPKHLDNFSDKSRIPRRNMWMAENCDIIIAYVEHAGSRIYEPIRAMTGKKIIFNLGAYKPPRPEK